MKRKVEWSDLKLFLDVARGGGLSGGSRRAGLSPATLGRRMTSLERCVGQQLFVRGRLGYTLTGPGRQLAVHAEDLEAAATDVERWRDGLSPRRTVRITAGTWMSWFLATKIASLRDRGDPFAIEFVTTNARSDIGHRHAEIGLRNARPDEPWLAGRRIGRIAFAAYRAKATPPNDAGTVWIGVSGDVSTPSSRWVSAHHGESVGLRGTDPHCVLELVRAGAGQAVLPCVVGDSDLSLERAGDPIRELSHDQWLVMHHEERDQPPVRTLIERIAGLVSRNQAALRGQG